MKCKKWNFENNNKLAKVIPKIILIDFAVISWFNIIPVIEYIVDSPMRLICNLSNGCSGNKQITDYFDYKFIFPYYIWMIILIILFILLITIYIYFRKKKKL